MRCPKSFVFSESDPVDVDIGLRRFGAAFREPVDLLLQHTRALTSLVDVLQESLFSGSGR